MGRLLEAYRKKSNRTTDAIRMLERCIQLEPLFTAAYLELAKLYGGQPAAAGRLLARVVRLNPYNADLRRQYGDWLMEQRHCVATVTDIQRAGDSRFGTGFSSNPHPSKQTDPHPQTEPAEISIRILRTPHCNRSEHLPNSLKACKLVTASSSPQPEPTTNPSPVSHTGKTGGKSKKWSKTRHKPKRQPPTGTALDPNGALAPLLVSNLLDKL
uniref:Uncharacterized protein n=1 Tax=Anopheles maculatus TaxID=74869 RepID=A0A182SSC0_9DIPT